ncbi:DUF4269 domain-containing protein [Brevibacillus ruminantium]|uniref:DUF4269 domain-containing protein n=1 Tax=Brevibacillus ruminantium TaxID=2950604 RepID=A0ABY4WLT8_9BACL|nr:DUF4269 domain-containing protein [Brevibacillus ruminantium]USG68047.1 DUF4269 domain-containing protein [Brevibacillus ruminantium]
MFSAHAHYHSRDWANLDYLKTGTPRQQAAWLALDSLGIPSSLQQFQPILTGTIPLSIDLAESDLDVIFFAEDLDHFDTILKERYGSLDHYKSYRTEVAGVPTSITSFWHRGFWLECFAQPVPVSQQNAFRHMIIEARLLQLAGDQVAAEIRSLKHSGLKTEPAFAHFFGISGEDPYQALLELEAYSETELRKLVKTAKHNQPTKQAKIESDWHRT